VNVALNRPSYSSSAWSSEYLPNKGNDGDKTNCDTLLPGQSITASAAELNPWYVIDLGVALEIAGVRFTNRVNVDGK